MFDFKTNIHDQVQFIVRNHLCEQNEDRIDQLEVTICYSPRFVLQSFLKVVQVLNELVIKFGFVETTVEELEQLSETVKCILIDVLQVLKLETSKQRSEA